MFRWLHKYYTNMLDKPSIIFPLNFWTFVNVRYFKVKFLRTVYLFISNLDFLKIKYISVMYRDWLFENFFFNSLSYIVVLLVVFFII